MQMPQDPDILDIIKMLMSVSEEVTEYINTQQFLCDVPNNDSLTEEGILTNCYRILLEELERKGITFFSDIDEILSSLSECERIYHLYCWIDTRHQIELCKTHNRLIEQLDNILNNDANEEDLIVSWVNCVSPIVGTKDPHLPHILRILNFIETNEHFKDLLTYVYTSVENTVFEIKQSIDVITAYTAAMYKGQEQAKKAFKILSAHWDGAFVAKIHADKLFKYLDRYDLEKLQPPYINDYAWAWTVETHYNEDTITYDDLPDDLKKKYDQLEYDHHTTTDHHIEYYLANADKPIDHKALILMAIACFEDGDSDTTENNFNKVISTAGDKFDKQCLSFFNKCKDVLVAYTKGEIQ